jgi:hypothetical protein
VCTLLVSNLVAYSFYRARMRARSVSSVGLLGTEPED